MEGEGQEREEAEVRDGHLFEMWQRVKQQRSLCGGVWEWKSLVSCTCSLKDGLG